MESQNTTADQILSLQLYTFLCQIVGSEKMVRARRIFFQTLDSMNVSRDGLWTTVSSGSKAEGIDFPGSDLDLMFINNKHVVYNKDSQIPHSSEIELLLDTDNAPAGFAQIKLNENSKHPRQKCNLSCMFNYDVYTENGVIFSNETSKTLYKDCIQKPFFENKMQLIIDGFFSIHGPCTSTTDGAFDFLICCKCQSWPKVANNWISRSRLSGWPSPSVISEIVRADVCLVPIGSKFGSANDNPYEWRISFSMAEKLLIHSFNHTQLLCYAMLKFVLKEIIDKKESTKKLMCSYFMKTLMFWIIEESGSSEWKPSNFFQCFRMCIKRLIYLVQLGTCPNYFIPENNMFEGKIFGGSRDELLAVVESVYAEGIDFVVRSKTLLEFIRPQSRSHIVLEPITYNGDIDKALYPLLHYLKFSGFSPILIRLLIYSRTSHLRKSIYFLHFTLTCGYSGRRFPYNQNDHNKKLYHQYKKDICLSLLGVCGDSVLGSLLLSAFFYTSRQFKKALMILNYAVSVCSSDKQLVDAALKPHKENEFPEQIGLTFLQRYKLSCVNLVSFEEPLHQSTNLAIINNLVCATPRIYAFFVSLMCHQYLANITEVRNAFNALQECTINSTNIYECVIGIMYLIKATQITPCNLPLSLIIKMNQKVLNLLQHTSEGKKINEFLSATFFWK